MDDDKFMDAVRDAMKLNAAAASATQGLLEEILRRHLEDSELRPALRPAPASNSDPVRRAVDDLPLTPGERAAVDRHRAAAANYDSDPREWFGAWPEMSAAVIAAMRRKLANGPRPTLRPDDGAS